MFFRIPFFFMLAFSAVYSIDGHLVARAGRQAQTSRRLVYTRSAPTLMGGKAPSGIIARSTQFTPQIETHLHKSQDGTGFHRWVTSWLSPTKTWWHHRFNEGKYAPQVQVSQYSPQKAAPDFNSHAVSSPPEAENPTNKDDGYVKQAPPSGSDSDRWLTAHNKVRSQYGAIPLVWNDTLANFAQGCANKCVWQHAENNDNGENIAAGQTKIEQVVDNWVYGPKERDEYSPSHPTDTHFTQVVWDNSHSIGCAQTTCDQVEGSGLPQPNPIFWVCEYYPPGNVVGEYDQNVNARAGGKPEA